MRVRKALVWQAIVDSSVDGEPFVRGIVEADAERTKNPIIAILVFQPIASEQSSLVFQDVGELVRFHESIGLVLKEAAAAKVWLLETAVK